MQLEVPASNGGAEALLGSVLVESDAILSSSSSDDDGNKNGAEGDGEDDKTNEKDGSNINNDSKEDDGNIWRNELLTMGKETKGGSKVPWFTDTTCTFDCTVVSSNNNSSNTTT